MSETIRYVFQYNDGSFENFLESTDDINRADIVIKPPEWWGFQDNIEGKILEVVTTIRLKTDIDKDIPYAY